MQNTPSNFTGYNILVQMTWVRASYLSIFSDWGAKAILRVFRLFPAQYILWLIGSQNMVIYLMIKVDVCLSSSIQFPSFSAETNDGKRQVMRDIPNTTYDSAQVLQSKQIRPIQKRNKRYYLQMMVRSHGDINHRRACFLLILTFILLIVYLLLFWLCLTILKVIN